MLESAFFECSKPLARLFLVAVLLVGHLVHLPSTMATQAALIADTIMGMKKALRRENESELFFAAVFDLLREAADVVASFRT